MSQTLTLSRAVHSMRTTAQACSRCPGPHAADSLPHMMRMIDQLERKLPVQTLQAQIPHENTSGGFELFNSGISDLAPELLGWYGAPGIDPAAVTSLFLVGKGFSVHDTRVIAGGRPARFRLLSREIIQVDIPSGAATVPWLPPTVATARSATRGLVLASAAEPLPEPSVAPPLAGACATCGDPALDTCESDCNRREAVEVHLATPYGVTGSLFVPVARRTDSGDCTLAFASSCTIGLTFTVTKATGSKTESAKVDEFFSSSCDAIEITVPEAFIPPPKAALRLLVRDASSGATAATFSFDDPFFDARRSRYVIAGAQLRNFIGDTSRPATDKTLRGAAKPYLDSLLLRGDLADDGDAVPLTITAALVSGEHELPIGGEIAVQATRRGKTTTEPVPDATP
jgi:hypothetical protein